MIHYVCKYTPVELLNAFGEECAVLEEMPENFEMSDQIAHANLCGFGKSVIQAVLEGKVKQLVLVNCCDSARRVYDIVESTGKCKFLYMLDLPHEDNECEKVKYAQAIMRLKKAYEKFSGKTFDKEAFLNSFTENETEMKPYIGLMGVRVTGILEKMIRDNIQMDVDNLTCTGGRQLAVVPEQMRQMDEEKMFLAYADALLCQIPCFRMNNNTRRNQLYLDPNLKGIIYHTIKFCDYYGFEYASIKKNIKVPLLKIETDFTSQSAGQLLTRIQAFAETIEGSEDMDPGKGISEEARKKMESGIYYVAGIDSGSTSTDVVILDQDGKIKSTMIIPTGGGAMMSAEKSLDLAVEKAGIKEEEIVRIVTTGYGRAYIESGDDSITEITCHAKGAHYLNPNVRTVIDIGGQDIKCFKIHNGAIDNIFLNEACSSGCGSFLQTFANALGYEIADFAKLGLFAKRPVDLGSRCTVFMNSSVKQAQKDGATIEDISAGLSLSVVKNALYKVIRASSPDELGKRVVVQGGTFLNDAVLRAFEQEMGVEVVRPNIAGLMGAYGAALYAKKKSKGVGKSTITDKKGLDEFVHEIKVANCGMCNNNCRLTINSFGKGRKFIAGNRCERPITKKAPANDMNMYAYKLNLIDSYKPVEGIRGKLGIPMALNMYELYPFWYRFFTELKFEVFHSPYSTRKLYQRGQQTIPSDTVCFPAKLVHGHIQTLIDMGAETIFYPCLSYNFDEHLGDNHYNCPVVAYYPEVIKNNMKDIRKVHFIKEYFGIHRPNDFPKKAYERLSFHFPDLTLNEVRNAAKLAYQEQENYRKKVIDKGNEIIAKAEKEGKKIFVLAGRPYHIDPEINHGIDRLISGFDVAIVSEDVISPRVEHFRTHVLNQWTYHARLYAAAKYVTTRKDMELVQLVSFGCGVDAITTDEVREILESKNKIYTQIKIDEITNLGAVKIRIRSLLAALEND